MGGGLRFPSSLAWGAVGVPGFHVHRTLGEMEHLSVHVNKWVTFNSYGFPGFHVTMSIAHGLKGFAQTLLSPSLSASGLGPGPASGPLSPVVGAWATFP